MAENLHGLDLLDGLAQAHKHVGKLFAHGGGAGRLAVGAAEHGHGGKLVRHAAQLGGDGVQAADHHLAPSAHLQSVAGVVDVFAGAGKVDKFGGFFQLGMAFELLFDPVLDGFYVVVGDLFFILDGLGIGLAEVGHQAQQKITGCAGQRRKLGQARHRTGR